MAEDDANASGALAARIKGWDPDMMMTIFKVCVVYSSRTGRNGAKRSARWAGPNVNISFRSLALPAPFARPSQVEMCKDEV